MWCVKFDHNSLSACQCSGLNARLQVQLRLFFFFFFPPGAKQYLAMNDVRKKSSCPTEFQREPVTPDERAGLLMTKHF